MAAGKTKCGKQRRHSLFSIWLPEENKEKVYGNGETMPIYKRSNTFKEHKWLTLDLEAEFQNALALLRWSSEHISPVHR